MKIARREALAGLTACLGTSCRPAVAPTRPTRSGARWLDQSLRPFPEPNGDGLLSVRVHDGVERAAIYDSALVALVSLRSGRMERAERIMTALAALQADDGSLPFSFVTSDVASTRGYVRSGALAWVGYAAAEVLDSPRTGRDRAPVAQLAHRIGSALLAKQITVEGDPRRGLITGGSGTYRYVRDRAHKRRVREELVPGDLGWCSVEHNVDAFFFLRRLARVAESPRYAAAAARIAEALSTRAWSETESQLVAGMGQQGPDPTLALDCATWGSVLLRAAGHLEHADRSRAAAARYASRDATTGARGHRAYARGRVYDDRALDDALGDMLVARTWDALDLVWPEGSAGVAFAALVGGDRALARGVLDGLEPLRSEDGALPVANVDVPFLFDRGPSLAGTAWVELVRFDLERETPSLWAP